MKTRRSRFVPVLLGIFACLCLAAQPTAPAAWSLQPADTLHKARFWTALGAGAAAYGASMIGLQQSWYADYPAGKFHFFNDLGEWNQMDKAGHLLMSYNESRWIYGGARWTGLKPRPAAWMGFVGGQLIQTSFEVFDGFSREWGFSWGDVGFNLLGSGLFLGQQLGWREQRVVLKMSAWPVSYSSEPVYAWQPEGASASTTLQQRADELYGTGPVNLFLKNYNTLVVWASLNPRAFSGAERSFWPRWLNLAVGMGSDNLFAGYGYSWQEDKGCAGPGCIAYRLDPDRYPRTRQLYLSLDVDLTRLPVRNPLLRTLLGAVNIFKIPAPALEWNSKRGVLFHAFYF